MVVEPTAVITALSLTLIGVGLMVRMLPVGTCTECSHCRMERLHRQVEVEARTAKFYGIPQCAACGRYHDPAEDHPAS